LDHPDHVAAADREIDDLLAALGAGPLAVPVPTCPAWTAADLTRHVGYFCTRWRDHLRGGDYEQRARPEDVTAPAGDDAAALAWLRGLADELLHELRSTPADTPVWSWYPANRTARFAARRCAHELAVHRHDAQTARGTAAPIAPPLAVDGIDEMLEALWRPRYVKGVAAGQTVHLHGTDDPDELGGSQAEWLVRLEADGPVVIREHAKGDLALRGSASDLELLLYGRPPLGEVQKFGDETILDLWFSVFRF
jgi:uncharacterized protein (TIGR03083 family)